MNTTLDAWRQKAALVAALAIRLSTLPIELGT